MGILITNGAFTAPKSFNSSVNCYILLYTVLLNRSKNDIFLVGIVNSIIYRSPGLNASVDLTIPEKSVLISVGDAGPYNALHLIRSIMHYTLLEVQKRWGIECQLILIFFIQQFIVST